MALTPPPTAVGVTPSASTLDSDLLAFADLGGFYSTIPAGSARQLASSPA